MALEIIQTENSKVSLKTVHFIKLDTLNEKTSSQLWEIADYIYGGP